MEKIERFFNTAGPGESDICYMVDPLKRIDFDEILTLIRKRRYFVLHAPRQTGKTTSLLAMVHRINSDGEFACVYTNVESAQMARDDVNSAVFAITRVLGQRVRSRLGKSVFIPEASATQDGLQHFLTDLCEKMDKPLVLFIDEIDSLVGDSLVSVLRQLRAGYDSRPENFPISVILCGVRDVRDYRIHTSKGEIITGGSCFNIKAKSLRLGDFDENDIRLLYGEHTKETGQIFEEAVFPLVWRLTHGQPWLVNALANEVTWEMRQNRDRSVTITAEMI